MKFGYARVSTNDQNLDIQVAKLKEAGCDEIYQEKISGKNGNRPELDKLLSRLRVGDTLCVVRLDRLGRRMMKMVQLIQEFKEKGIEFIALENHIDTTTPMGMLLFQMCAAFSEMERELIKERVQAGVNAAKLAGRKGGRPKSLTPEKKYHLQALIQSGKMSVDVICRTVGISRSVYYREVSNNKRKT